MSVNSVAAARKVVLVGLRTGATLAMQASMGRNDIEPWFLEPRPGRAIAA